MILHVLRSAPADRIIANRNRFSTVLSFSYADPTTYGAAMVAVLRNFSWNNIALISDIVSGKWGETSKAAQLCGGMRTELNKVLPEINFLDIKTDALQEGWRPALKEARNYSRSKYLYTSPVNRG